MHEEHFATIRSWVGRSYAELRCWDVIVEANRLRGVEIPGDYAAALERRMFRTVTDPEPWDVVLIIEHEMPIVSHVGLVIPDALYIQSIQKTGLVIRELSREPAFGCFATKDGKAAFLRLRQAFIQ